MSVQNMMIRIVEFRNNIASVSPDHNSYQYEIKLLRNEIATLKLSRERFACTELLNAMLHDIAVHELTLGYQKHAVMYVTHKKPVPNCESTKVLHEQNLSMAEWDTYKKFHVWVKTGEVLGVVLA